MADFGVTFNYPDNSFQRVWHTGMLGPENEDNSDYNGKTVLFSCVDINNGWDWLYRLKELYDAIQGESYKDEVAVVAIVFNYNGSMPRGNKKRFL